LLKEEIRAVCSFSRTLDRFSKTLVGFTRKREYVVDKFDFSSFMESDPLLLIAL
jgi:hypothetical protein